MLEFCPIFNGLQNHSPFYKIQVYNGEKIAIIFPIFLYEERQESLYVEISM